MAIEWRWFSMRLLYFSLFGIPRHQMWGIEQRIAPLAFVRLARANVLPGRQCWSKGGGLKAALFPLSWARDAAKARNRAMRLGSPGQRGWANSAMSWGSPGQWAHSAMGLGLTRPKRLGLTRRMGFLGRMGPTRPMGSSGEWKGSLGACGMDVAVCESILRNQPCSVLAGKMRAKRVPFACFSNLLC